MAEWGKVYGSLHGSPKWRRATKGARALWTTALSWCIDQEAADGEIPRDMLRVLDGTAREAACLADVGLWDLTDGGWRFHDWEQRQRSREQITRDREAAAERQRRARERRHGVTKPDSHGVTNGVSHAAREEESREEESREETSSLLAAPAAGDAAPKSTRRKPERPLPESWAPSEKHQRYATEHHLDLARETTAFRNHAQTHDRRARDWDAAFRTWLTKATERPRLAAVPAGPQVSAWDRQYVRGPE